jgi:hypothetical protein
VRSFTGQPGTVLSGPGNVQLAARPLATIQARACFFPVSGWVHAFILTCDLHLAVWFKRRRRRSRRHGRRHRRHAHGRATGGVPGVCCLYPGTNGQHYTLATIWHSPGRFVRRFLHRKMGYQIVAPPRVPCGPCGAGGPGSVTLPCCPNPLPQTLHVTLTGALSGSYALAWDGAHTWTNTNVTGCGGSLVSVGLSCAAGSWSLTIGAAGASGSGTCNPLSLSFTVPTPCGSVGATVTL